MIYTGQTDESLVRAYYQWDGDLYIQACPGQSCPNPDPWVPAWASQNASRVPAATLGKQFRRNLQSGDTLQAFVTNAYRAFTLRNVNGATVTVKGIPLLTFTIDASVFQNATVNPANADYYQFGPRGFANISKIEHGMNVFLSQPHYLHADPAILDEVGGLNPDPAIHDTLVNVEPNLGTTMDARKSIQVSWYIGPIDNHEATNPDYRILWPNVPRCHFPVAWFEERGTIPDAAARTFRNSVLLGQYIVRLATYLGGILCAVCFVMLGYLWYDTKNWTSSSSGTSIQADDHKVRLLDEPVHSGSDRKTHGDL